MQSKLSHDILTLNLEQLKEVVVSLGEKRFRAEQIYQALHHQGVDSIEDISTLSQGFKEVLAKACFIPKLTLRQVKISQDGTRKYEWGTWDHQIIESVFIPNASRDGRNTLCISSQVGCAMGCKFCATAALKLKRNLLASEIVSQIYQVNRHLKETHFVNPLTPDEPSEKARLIHNIVYMGMGEPLHNYDNVLKSIQILTNPKAQNYSPRRITVSTSGLVPKIRQLGQDSTVHIAISLNASTNEVRSQIMPVNLKWNIETLIKACREFPLAQRRRITFEYVLLAGINDTNEDAYRVCEWLKNMRCKVNLIPFNEHPLSPYKKPPLKRTLEFQRILIQNDIATFIRTTRGDDVDAACGMLGAKKLQDARLLKDA